MTTVRFTPDQRAIAELSGPGGLVFEHVLKFLRASEARAKQNAPVDTGNLRASIRYTIVPSIDGVTGSIGSEVVYARPQEFRGAPGSPIRLAFQPGSQRGGAYISDAVRKVNELGNFGFTFDGLAPVLRG